MTGDAADRPAGRQPEQPESGAAADIANGERPAVDDTTHERRTGERQAAENRENDPPA